MASGVSCMLITSLMRLLFRHIHPFLERIFFKTTWLVVLCIAHSIGAEEIPFLGCFIGKRGARADPAKVKAIVDWSIPKNQKESRNCLGLANYLHRYSENHADMARPLTDLLTKDADWRWDNTMLKHFRQ